MARICLVGEDLDWIDGQSIQATIAEGLEYVAEWVPNADEVHLSATGVVEKDLRWSYSAGLAPSWARLAISVPDTHDLHPDAAPRRVITHSNVPWQAGLASSACLAVAVCRALNPALSGLRLAKAAFELEHRKAGRQIGPMDHLAIALGGVVGATFVGNGVVETTTLSWPSDLAVLVVDTLTPRDTSAVIAAKSAKVECRDRGAMRYVSRTRALAEDLRALLTSSNPEPHEVGVLVSQAHASMRDDMGVSTPLIEDCVRRLMDAGCVGAKISGTGHGGCLFALTARSGLADARASLAGLPVRAFATSVRAQPAAL